MKDRKDRLGSFVPLQRPLLNSPAYLSLSNSSKIAYTYFLYDKKNKHQDEVTLTFSQAKKFKACKSPSTFAKAKRELVKYGFLDPLDGGGLNAHAIFKLSLRWKRFGDDDFKEIPYKPGVSSKYFKTCMANPEQRQKLIQARHGKPPS
jgi:hypothetical protein